MQNMGALTQMSSSPTMNANSIQPQSGTPPGGSGAGSMPGQQLGYGNMLYNANNSNQQAMNTFANNQGFNQNQFNQIYNPYISDVVNNANTIAQRQFQQQQMPALQSQFGASGQAGSARAMATMEQANNQNSQNILQNQASLMNQGFQQAMQNYQGLQSNALNAGNGLLNAGTAGSNMANQQMMAPANYNAVNAGALTALGQTVPSLSQTQAGTLTNWAT